MEVTIEEITLEQALADLRDDVLVGARSMLGLTLVRGERRARVVEVEAYRTPDDPASHAHRGKTPRNAIMFGEAGLAYVYFNYGVHWMLNVTAHSEGDAAAVLIRAAQPIEDLDEMRSLRPKAKRDEDLLSGPGKLAAAFEITGADTGTPLFSGEELRFEQGSQPSRVLSGPRIGIRVGLEHNWRFVDGDALRWVSAEKSGMV